MEVIIIGLYNQFEKKIFAEDLLNSCDLEIEWDYDKFKIESSKGIKLLEKVYNLKIIGILVERNRKESFTSYPLIYEISEFVINGSKKPRLFQFIDEIQKVGIKKMVMAFADYWDEKTLIRIQRNDFEALKKNLNNIYSWCETYVNLISNEEIRNDEHPLVFEIENF